MCLGLGHIDAYTGSLKYKNYFCKDSKLQWDSMIMICYMFTNHEEIHKAEPFVKQFGMSGSVDIVDYSAGGRIGIYSQINFFSKIYL